MGIKSSISWTDHTINFWTGCKKVSQGCAMCYMYRDKERYGHDPTTVLKVNDSTINKVLRTAVAGDKIFTCSWSDFFIDEADEWRDWAWDIIRKHPQFSWQILTKRPERIKDCLPADWGDGWDNVWIGVSVESHQYTDRIHELLAIKSKVKFLSVEPLIGPVYLDDVYGLWDKTKGSDQPETKALKEIDWVIVGGESGNDIGKWRYRPCELEWIETVVADCKAHGTPVFVKQTGTYLQKKMNLHARNGTDISEFPESLKFREFPNVKK